MGCGSSTSTSPPASTARDKDAVPSPQDNHDDGSRVRTRENTPNAEEQANQKLEKLDDDRKERERDKQERDEKLQQRIEEEKMEREQNKLNNDENKENEKPEQSEMENGKSDKKRNDQQLKQKNDVNQKIEEQEKQKAEQERLKLEDQEKQKREDEERRKLEEQKSQIVKVDEDKLMSRRDETDSSGLKYREAYNGLKVHSEDFRDHPEPPMSMRPPDNGQDLYTDHSFTLADALQQQGDGLDWKRPQEFCESPVLFSEGTTRFDIGQGSAGTCWFLSLVASISERRDIMKEIFPDDAYPLPGSANYRGVFHCRFWRFGVREDVYIDDFLPVMYERVPWGAKSATDPNEMWVALLEKAFAKFHGSYLDVYGGQTVDAFLTLTGGVGERVTLDKANPEQLFRRLRNALCSRAVVTCTVPAEKNGVHGLIGAHAYSLTGVTLVIARGEEVPLVRIRNPWGRVEWTGPWSDNSSEWRSVQKGEPDMEVKDDGEFWMSLQDFFEYFSQASICSVSPDFDMDGRKDELDYLTEMCGEWKGESAAGYKNLMANPRFLITVPKAGAQDNGVVPLVIQVVQRMENRKDQKLSFRCDMFQVLGGGSSCGRKSYVYQKLGGDGDNTYYTDRQHSFRHAVTPGQYMIVPSAFKEGQESDFMIRVFSPCKLEECEKVEESAMSMSCEMDEKLGECELKHSQCMFGRWERGRNSGGQISHNTHHANPQIAFSVDNEDVAVEIDVMQEARLPKLPMGVKVYKLSPGAPVPITQDYLLRHYEDAPTTTDGEQGKFVISWDVNAPYLLPKGDYLCIFFTDQPDESKDIAVAVKSSAKLDIKQYQMS